MRLGKDNGHECFQLSILAGPRAAVHAFNPSPQEAESGHSPWIRRQPDLQIQVQAMEGYIVTHCLKKKKKSKEKKKKLG